MRIDAEQQLLHRLVVAGHPGQGGGEHQAQRHLVVDAEHEGAQARVDRHVRRATAVAGKPAIKIAHVKDNPCWGAHERAPSLENIVPPAIGRKDRLDYGFLIRTGRRAARRRLFCASGGAALDRSGALVIRLFVALAMPGDIAERLRLRQHGLPGARWRAVQSLHITLRFFGEVAENLADDLDTELAAISAERFPMQLSGVGVFDDGVGVRAVWAGVAENSALRRLASRCNAAARRSGLARERRRFAPM